MNIKLIQYASGNLNMQGNRHFVRISIFEKIENFENAVEFLLLKTLKTLLLRTLNL